MLERLKPWTVPILLAGTLLALLIAFSAVALPFLVAVLVVYVIEPVVQTITRRKFLGRVIERWAAVSIVYTLAIGLVLSVSAFLVPRIVAEASNLSETLPQTIGTLRDRHLPRINAAIARATRYVQAGQPNEREIYRAEVEVAAAWDAAIGRAALYSSLSAEERVLYRAGHVVSLAPAVAPQPQPALFRLRTGDEGAVELVAGDDPIYFQETQPGTYRIVSGSAQEEGAEGGFSIESSVEDLMNRTIEQSTGKVASVIELGQRVLKGLAAALVSFVITFMVAAFISIDAPRIYEHLFLWFPPEARDHVRELLRRINFGLAGVVRGQIAIAAINGVLTGVGLVLFGVKFAALLAVVAFFFSFIPIFGTIISTIPCVLIGLTQSFSTGLLVLAWILFVHFIEANFLNPKVMGTSARIHPAIVVFALLAGESAFGLVGALLAVPAASIVQTVLVFIRDHHPATAAAAAGPNPGAAPLASEPATSPAGAPAENVVALAQPHGKEAEHPPVAPNNAPKDSP